MDKDMGIAPPQAMAGDEERAMHSNGISEETDSDTHSISPASTLPPIVEGKSPEDAFPTQQATSIYEEPIPVPRSRRRGLFAQFTLLAEVENPKTYPRRTKWFITFIVAVAAAAAPMGSSIFFPSLSQVAKDLNSTLIVTNLSIALYMLSMSIFPLWWSSFSETLGRRTIYLVSFVLFTVFNLLSAVSTSIAMLIVFRMLSGGASASVQAVGAGTIADLWEPRERGRAMGIFYLGPLCGPLFAPIIGGALAQRWGWRSTQWFSVIYGGVALLFIFVALPETLVSRNTPIVEVEPTAPMERPLSRVSSRQVLRSTARLLKALKIVILDPLKIILYLRFPPVLLTVYYASITFGSLYVLNVSIEDTFGKPPYNFSTILVGLLYIPNSLGYVTASLFGGKWMDSIMQREARKANRYDEKGKLVYRPEDRMRENALLGAIIYPGALIWYGWTVERGVFWLVPMIANFFFGIGSMLIFSMATTMLTEFMPKKSSSGVALNNFMRNIFSCVGTIVAAPVINAIGNGWLFTILGLVAIISSSSLLFMRWRRLANLLLLLGVADTGSAAPTPTALNATATRSKSATSESVSASAGGASFEYWGSASLFTRHVFASAGAVIVLAIGLAVAWRLAGLPPISYENVWGSVRSVGCRCRGCRWRGGGAGGKKEETGPRPTQGTAGPTQGTPGRGPRVEEGSPGVEGTGGGGDRGDNPGGVRGVRVEGNISTDNNN